MSATLPGVAFSGLTPTPLAGDGDTLLLLQGGMFRQVAAKALVASYTPAGAVLLGAASGAGRDLPLNTVPGTGDPMQGYSLGTTLQIEAAPNGGLPLLVANVGTIAGTLAAGDDARIVAGAAAAASAGQAMSIASTLQKTVELLEAQLAALQDTVAALQAGGSGGIPANALDVSGITVTVDGQPLTP